MNGVDIYKMLWDENIPVTYVNAWNKKHKKYSKNSFAFGIQGIDYANLKKDDMNCICSKIKENFEINSNLFEKKFEEACSGSGTELLKITTLHSSSLCALLFFYNVAEKKIEFKEIPDVIFDDVFFEFKTPVIDSQHPSNMDVVLKGKNKKTGERVCLFLESKFSEYLSSCKSEIISKKYWENEDLPISYNVELLQRLNLKKNEEKNDEFTISALSSSVAFYAEGVKQMISHFIGVYNFIQGNKSKKETRELELPDKVYLAEILFDFKNSDTSKSFELYAEKYAKLSEILNEKIKEKKCACDFEVLPSVLSYEDLKKYKKNEEKIYSYYFGKK